jgi:hypothetical protein
MFDLEFSQNSYYCIILEMTPTEMGVLGVPKCYNKRKRIAALRAVELRLLTCDVKEKIAAVAPSADASWSHEDYWMRNQTARNNTRKVSL